jgi:(4S)-4-hydroxy-5-phosphonooxypentane-2,3-dione isomerase
MFTTLVHVTVKAEFIDRFILATKENHEQSIKEPGNLRFDILQDNADRSRFVLYEAYATEEAVSAHKETAHIMRNGVTRLHRGWRSRVKVSNTQCYSLKNPHEQIF